MRCAIYRSSKKEGTYLYIESLDDFSRVPEELMRTFGTPALAMTLDLAKREALAMADIERVKQALSEQGFYLQVPPPVESLLKTEL
ncbi:YcgL domain-containing protein [Leminorella grimontii]|uniref:YcgL domain-containing protein SOASR030_09090 n=1 Tax=Leminorella grimontii TaxID=82981 RepID=A0AAV5N2X9_9GAMM|nr:YcgL domain-containing protein [Leminorella grimontii]KFC96021.1 YcgL family protein [Leminorella grimontii ATCC 33999 = DSM 5078]GKX54797.1 YcgL domain-containing protein [Leminorella grimontii]VFS58435.1 YcgL domain [Leminorella grimontii]